MNLDASKILTEKLLHLPVYITVYAFIFFILFILLSTLIALRDPKSASVPPPFDQNRGRNAKRPSHPNLTGIQGASAEAPASSKAPYRWGNAA